jgi:hypothetical protein
MSRSPGIGSTNNNSKNDSVREAPKLQGNSKFLKEKVHDESENGKPFKIMILGRRGGG